MCIWCSLKNKFNHWMNNFYAKKIYIDFLQEVRDYEKANKETNTPPTKLVSFYNLENIFGYDKNEIEVVCKKLVSCGFLKDTTGSSNIFITDQGNEFLRNFHIFTTKSFFAKFTVNYQNNLIGVIAILALLISVIKH